MHEADQPDVVGLLPHAHVLTGKDLAEIDLPMVVADAPAMGDRRGPVMPRIGDRCEAAMEMRRTCELAGRLHRQRLMRTRATQLPPARPGRWESRHLLSSFHASDGATRMILDKSIFLAISRSDNS